MVHFTATLQKFGEKGEKSGWVYIEIPPDVAEQLNPGVRTSYRVKGIIDAYRIKQTALLPMGDGIFILPTNATIRRNLRKQEGASVVVELELDSSPYLLSNDLLDCLADAPAALDFFNTLGAAHQNYFSKWIESARTSETKTRRITQAVQGLEMGMGYGEMIRYFKNRS